MSPSLENKIEVARGAAGVGESLVLREKLVFAGSWLEERESRRRDWFFRERVVNTAKGRNRGLPVMELQPESRVVVGFLLLSVIAFVKSSLYW